MIMYLVLVSSQQDLNQERTVPFFKLLTCQSSNMI